MEKNKPSTLSNTSPWFEWDMAEPDTLAALAGHDDPKIRARVGGHRNTPDPVRRQLARDSAALVRQSLVLFLNEAPELLLELAEDPDGEVRALVARAAGTPAEGLAKLATDPDQEIRTSVARHANASPKILARLATDPCLAVKEEVAWNGNTTAETLSKLATDDQGHIRRSVARNRNSSAALLWELSSDPTVRKGIASNLAAPPELLEKLVHDSDLEVRWSLAENPSIPPDLLEILTRDISPNVRVSAISNPQATAELLSQMGNDDNREVCCALANHLKSPPSLLAALLPADMDYSVCSSLSFNPNTPPDVLNRLAGHSVELIRQNVARHKQTASATLALLSEDPEASVRHYVALNSSTPEECRKKLASDKAAMAPQTWEEAMVWTESLQLP